MFRTCRPSQYNLRYALAALVIGWYGSACYYGLSNPRPFIPAAHAEQIQAQSEPPELNVTCTFDFPPLPMEALEADNG